MHGKQPHVLLSSSPFKYQLMEVWTTAGHSSALIITGYTFTTLLLPQGNMQWITIFIILLFNLFCIFYSYNKFLLLGKNKNTSTKTQLMIIIKSHKTDLHLTIRFNSNIEGQRRS